MKSTPAEPSRFVGRRASDAVLRRALELTHLGWWQTDVTSLTALDQNKTSWSDEVFRIFGHEPQSFQPTAERFFSQVPNEDHAAINAAIERAFTCDDGFEVEHRVIRTDGSVRIVDDRATIERDANGAPVRMIGTILDITDRRKIEDALRGSDTGSRLLAQLVEHSHDAILSTTLDGVITTWNPAAEQVFGWKAAEIVGRQASVLARPERQQEIARHLDLATRGETLGSYETIRVRRDGTPVNVEISVSPIIDSASTPIGVSVIIRDVTQQKRMGAQLQHAQRLESVGRLAGGVAHDFNNLLMAITGYAELVMMDLPEDSPSREDLRALLGSAERGARLTRQLLAFGRRQVLHPIALDVNAVVRDMENILRPLTSTDIALRFRLTRAPAEVVADRAQLEQVVVNLVANACDALPHGGAIDVDTSLVEFGPMGSPAPPSVEPGRYVRLLVKDTGIGMDADVQSRLFEPFFSTKLRGTSAGMGLATTYGIVKQSGGFITVESAPEQGSTFRVFLPVRGESFVEHGSDLHADEDDGTIILLVEDDEGVRDSTKGLLERLGYTVLDAASPTAALDILRVRGADIDLVLTDIVLPEMSGLRLAEQVRAERPSVRIVYMSAFPDAADRDGLDAGVNYLSKPFTVDALARMLRDALTR